MNLNIVFTKGTLALLSFGFTTLVFMNTYEVVFNEDIPVASSVERIVVQNTVNELIHDFSIKNGTVQGTFNSSLDNLQGIDIAAINVKVQLEEARKIGGAWYSRPSYGSYLGLNKDSRNTVIDYLIYTRESWRTFPDGGQIEPGMAVDLFYDNGSRSAFTVESRSLLESDQSFIVSKAEERQLILIIEDSATDEYYGYSLVRGV